MYGYKEIKQRLYINKMTSDHIKITAKLRSVSKAAEKLCISQPALSAQIKKIEEENGLIIFDRTR